MYTVFEYLDKHGLNCRRREKTFSTRSYNECIREIEKSGGYQIKATSFGTNQDAYNFYVR